ncbi:MAG: peptidylprolyl isomerase, partial [Pseudomonadales bacterium]|nr:peptidylprolyl isomerase [Pseudomonadales bacterium]
MRKTLSTILLGAFLSFCGNTFAAPQLLDRIVAIVDDDIIMESELITRSASIRQKMRGRNTPVPPTDVLLEQVLEKMVVESIELQLASRAGIRIGDNEINETIKNIARQNKMSTADFQSALASEGMSYKQLRDQIKNEMTINQLRQRRVSNRIQVSDQDIDNFLNSDLGKTNLAPDYRLGHILIAVAQTSTPGETEAAEEKAYKLYEQLKEGADFAELAVNYSSGQNALKGGDLGWRKAAQLPTLFAETVLEMGNGEVAEPIRSPSGFHIIKVTDLRGGTEHVIQQTEV